MAGNSLKPDHFAAYAPEKWSSNVHNLPRMQAKEALVNLCAQAEGELEQELKGLTRSASDEIPNILNQKKVDAQWVYWFRDPTARKALASFLEKTPLSQEALLNTAAHQKHIILTVVLNQDGLGAGLRIGPAATVDERNLAALLRTSWHRQRFLELAGELPSGAQLRIGERRADPSNLEESQLLDIATELETGQLSIWLGHELPRAEALELDADLADYIRRWLGALVPLYHFMAWSHDNDLIEASKKIQEEKEQKRREVKSLKKGDPVRITGGFFAGKKGEVEGTDTKSQVRVRIGNMSVKVPDKHLTPT